MRSFDLPAEIGQEIFRHLFSGQIIKIRAHDESTITDEKGTRKVVNFLRNRTVGLNILFVSKACLADAKPAVLTMAKFDVDLDEICSNLESNDLAHPNTV
jgi:hypothetical protein